MPHQVQLAMLGGFDLRRQGSRVDLPPSAERLVAYLALHRGPATRPSVAGTLWMDAPDARAMANLRSALWRIRRPGLMLVRSSGDNLSLADDVEVDIWSLTETAHDWLTGGRPPTPSDVTRLAGSGELLADWYEDWVLLEREHFRQLRLQALERMAGILAGAGEFGRAVESALAAVASEPLRESAHRALISVHLAQGNRAEAIRQYCIYERLMADELDLGPSREMTELIGPVSATAMQRLARTITAR